MEVVRDQLREPNWTGRIPIQPGQILEGVVAAMHSKGMARFSWCAGAAVPISPDYGTTAASAGEPGGRRTQGLESALAGKF